MGVEASAGAGKSYYVISAGAAASTGPEVEHSLSAFGWEAERVYTKLKMARGAEEANCRS